MKKGLTEIVFILDRSGSMAGLEADTIGGFNSMLERQKKEEGDAIISTVLFDDKTEILHDRIDLKKVEKMTDREYFVRGCTALLDAVGGAIHHTDKMQRAMPESERPEKTLFIITTDGMENASKEYTYAKVKKMVEKKKRKQHWEFIFMGANIDAIEVAVRYECDEEGTALNFSVMSKLVSCARSCGSAKMMNAAYDEAGDEMLDEIRADYKKRHGA